MYAKIYSYKFSGLSEAKVAATFCSDSLGKKIVPYNIRSLNISIGQCGSVSIKLNERQHKENLDQQKNIANSQARQKQQEFDQKEMEKQEK